jgi:hypothetical protein
LTNFALTDFTDKEIVLLKELVGNHFEKIKTLKLSDANYKTILFTQKEITEIKQKLDQINTPEAKNLSAKLMKIKGEETVSRIINLSGKEGSKHSGAAANGDGSGAPGNSGEPGKLGESAGNFFMVSNKIIKEDRAQLKVILNGGNGGAGQTGGDGVEGGKGENATVHKLQVLGQWIVTTPKTPAAGYDFENRLAIGETGKPGGKAGDGGIGGNGGKSGDGTAVLFNGESVKAETFEKEDGKQGDSGKQGTPGEGGWYGNGLHNSFRWWGNQDANHQMWDGNHAPQSPTENAKHGREVRGKKGDEGKAGGNSQGIKDSKSVLCNRGLSLLSYRIFLEQEALKHFDVIGDSLSLFAQQCDGIDITILNSTTKNLLEEANALEEYSSQQGRVIDFAPFYYTFLERVKKFALTSGRTFEELKVLEYLYVATLGSLARINTAADNILVINIRNYLVNLVERDFETLKKLKADELKNYYRQQYDEQIEGKIDEAKLFLGRLKADIEQRHAAIWPEIKRLKKEVEAAKRAGHSQLKTLQDKRRELDETLKKNVIFGVVRIAIQSVGMVFPPAGPIVAGVVNAGLSMAQNPTFESVTNFAGKAIEMKSQLGDLPKGETSKKHEVDLFTKVKEMARTVEPLLRDAKELLSNKNAGDAQLAQLDSQIAQVKAYINLLEEYLGTVPNALSNYLEGIVHDVKSFQNGLQDKSLVALDFSKLEIKRFFDSVKHNIKVVIGDFAKSDGFEDIATKLAEAIDVSVTICMRVQDYRDHIAFANFVAHLLTPLNQDEQSNELNESKPWNKYLPVSLLLILILFVSRSISIKMFVTFSLMLTGIFYIERSRSNESKSNTNPRLQLPAPLPVVPQEKKQALIQPDMRSSALLQSHDTHKYELKGKEEDAEKIDGLKSVQQAKSLHRSGLRFQ